MPRSTPSEQRKSNKFLHGAAHYTKAAILPILLALIPTLYHYSVNVQKLTPISLWRMVVFNTAIAIVVYIICLAFTRFQVFKAANAACIFLIFFNIYGIVYRYLLYRDVIRVRHYTLLPLMIMIAIYAIGFTTRLKDTPHFNLWKNLLLITSVLVLFNVVNIAPAELQKSKSSSITTSSDVQAKLPINKKSPDIYYIIFDEFEGFQGMRDYWKYQGVDNFVSFLKSRGFFVAEASHSSTTDTLHEMASRLNYQEYPPGEDNLPTKLNDIAANRVVSYLKSRGYTTVVFDETKMGYPSAKSIQADYVYEYGSAAIPQGEVGTYGLYFDEFGELVIDNTMFYAISQKYRNNNPLINQHANMISFTVDNIANQEVPSPKFVHVHLLLPHAPFIFDENGNIVDSDRFTNWNYYIDNYKFSIRVAEKMIDNILLQADPKNPPIIILQSDHGARNTLSRGETNIILQNYPENLKSLIMFALYMPGYDYSALPQDIKPVNTFPIVFNYVFDDHIALLK